MVGIFVSILGSLALTQIYPKLQFAIESANYNSTKLGFAYFGFYPGNLREKRNPWFILY
jgi:hypothetical protein